MKINIKKWAPLCFVILIALLFFIFDLQRYFNFTTFQKYHHLLKEKVDHHLFVSLILFALLYTLVSATALPIAVFLTILGGFLFGPLMSLIIIDISATLGATCLFLIVKTTLGEELQKKATPWVQKMEEGFQKNAFSYLLFLRLVPLFPFWVVTLVAALVGVSLRTFFLATLIGIIPGTFVYSLVGNGLGVLLAQGKVPNLKIVFTPEIFWPLCGLAFLSLLPVLYKKRKTKNDKTEG